MAGAEKTAKLEFFQTRISIIILGDGIVYLLVTEGSLAYDFSSKSLAMTLFV